MRSIRSVLLVGHTHHDVGYTNSPRLIDRQHAEIVAHVLDLLDEHGGVGPSSFRWTFEVARPVLQFLRDAAPADVERLRRSVAAGDVSVTGGYLNNTQLASIAELDTAYDQLARLAAAGLPVRTEQHGDVNGIAWGSVPAMRRAGIERLVMALNPDHGRPPFTQPTGFWWEGPDASRIFVWLSTHYGFGEEWGIVDADLPLAVRRIEEFIAGLEARDDYPYETAVVHAGNDNRWPTALFLQVVDRWNELHPDRAMRTATIDQALDELLPQAERADIPVVRGEWADWWSHGHGSTAREVAAYREARGLEEGARSALGLTLLRGDGDPELATVLGYRRGPVRLRTPHEIRRDLAHVDEQLMLFNEHTWGSWETYSKPFSAFSHSHWNAKAAFAYEAYDHARDLAVEGLFRLVASGPAEGGSPDPVADDVFVVVNPTERARTEPVTVEIDGHVRHTVLVSDVPAFGVAVVPIERHERAAEPVREVTTARWRVEVDPQQGGVRSLRHLDSDRELIDTAAAHGLGAVVVERVPEDSTHPMVTRSPKDFHPDHPGPDFERIASISHDEPLVSRTGDDVEISWSGTAPGVPEITTRLRLFADSDLVEVEVEMRKPEVFGPESIHVAFPFAVDEPRFLLETAGAVFEAQSEQLDDTSKDWYSIQGAIGIGRSAGILWGTADAPLVQLGGIHTGEWARELDVVNGHVYSWLMNNLHFTNFQARQEGTGRYRYRFLPVPEVDRPQVARFGRDVSTPLLSRAYAGPVRMQGAAGLTVTPSDAVLAELDPQEDGSVRIRLRSITDESVDVSLGWEGGGVVFDRSTLTIPPLSRAETTARRG